jgi:5-methylcytosine-specific restriction endonuclease McrA
VAITRRLSGGSVQRTAQASRRVGLKGYAKSRVDYDRRRRSRTLDAAGLAYKRIVQADPCSYCGAAPGPDMAADHIDGLDAGGEQSWLNLSAACRRCNASKRERSLLMFLLHRSQPS